MTPDDGAERWFRDSVLALAEHADFARPMVNSGRLSKPCIYPLDKVPDDASLPEVSRPGAVAPDAPMGDGWLLNALGREPALLAIGIDAPPLEGCRKLEIDDTPFMRERYLGEAVSAVYLVRPDQVIAARWCRADEEAIDAALKAMWEGMA